MGIINNFINRRINKAIIELNSRKTIEPTITKKADKNNIQKEHDKITASGHKQTDCVCVASENVCTSLRKKDSCG